MQDRNGKVLWPGQEVIISDTMVKKCSLPVNFGIVVDSAYNSEQLVSVDIAHHGKIDFHAKSLTIITERNAE